MVNNIKAADLVYVAEVGQVAHATGHPPEDVDQVQWGQVGPRTLQHLVEGESEGTLRDHAPLSC